MCSKDSGARCSLGWLHSVCMCVWFVAHWKPEHSSSNAGAATILGRDIPSSSSSSSTISFTAAMCLMCEHIGGAARGVQVRASAAAAAWHLCALVCGSTCICWFHRSTAQQHIARQDRWWWLLKFKLQSRCSMPCSAALYIPWPAANAHLGTATTRVQSE